MPTVRPSIALSVSLMLVAAAYSNVVDVGFMWDDKALIVENPAAHHALPVSAFFGRTFWAHPFADGNAQSYFRPLVAFSFAVNWVMGDGSPVPFHLTNLFAHLIACALVFALAQTRPGSNAVSSAIVAAFFGLFPRLTESTTWVVGRTDVFAAVFALFALWLETTKPGDAHRRFYVAIAILLGLLCKEVTIGVIVVIAWSSLRRLGRKTNGVTVRSEVFAALPLMATLAGYALLRSSSSSARAPVLNGPLEALGQLGSLTAIAFNPWVPSAANGFSHETLSWSVALGLGFLAGSVWLIARGFDWWWAALVAALMVTVPNLNYSSSTSDRFLYLPVALAACIAAPMVARQRTRMLLVALFAFSFAPVTFMRNRLWAHELEFWRRTAQQADPRDPIIDVALGDAVYLAQGPEAALPYYRRAVEKGASATSFIGLSIAAALSGAGDDEAALAQLKTLDTARRRNAFDEALFLARALRFDEAKALLPRLERVYGRDEAFERLERAVLDAAAEWPKATSSTAKAKVYDLLGAVGHAQEHFEQVLSAPSSTPAEKRAALAWLVIKAPMVRADAALAELQKSETPETVEGLRAILDERR